MPSSMWSAVADFRHGSRSCAAAAATPSPAPSADPWSNWTCGTLYLKDLRLLGCTVLEAGVFANLVRYIERGDIRPLLGTVSTALPPSFRHSRNFWPRAAWARSF